MESVIVAFSTYLTGVAVYRASRIGHCDDGEVILICRREAWLEGILSVAQRWRRKGGGRKLWGFGFVGAGKLSSQYQIRARKLKKKKEKAPKGKRKAACVAEPRWVKAKQKQKQKMNRLLL